MRTRVSFPIALAISTTIVLLAGCGSESPPDKTPAADSSHHEGDGHDHSGEEAGHFEGDGHDHGDAAAGAHPTEGPHGGHLIELGNEEFHAELLHDEASHTVSVHILDSAGKTPVTIDSPQITLQLFIDGQFATHALNSAPGQAAGAASHFQTVSESLCDSLCHDEEVRGRLQVSIGGKPFTGTIEHSSHGEHDHEGHDHGEDHNH